MLPSPVHSSSQVGVLPGRTDDAVWTPPILYPVGDTTGRLHARKFLQCRLR